MKTKKCLSDYRYRFEQIMTELEKLAEDARNPFKYQDYTSRQIMYKERKKLIKELKVLRERATEKEEIL